MSLSEWYAHNDGGKTIMETTKLFPFITALYFINNLQKYLQRQQGSSEKKNNISILIENQFSNLECNLSQNFLIQSAFLDT